MSALLEIADLTVEFRTRGGTVRALEGVNLSIAAGEIVGVVGESGSGKSVTAYAALGLLDRAGRITQGRIRLAGVDVLSARSGVLEDLRGREAAMIFQNPRAALNPIRRVGRQIVDVLRRHRALTTRQARERALDALSRVQIGDPLRRFEAYPFELSGGMCQRVMIALALACEPRLLIADEPSTGLDVTTQAVIMDLIRELSRARRMATLLITHDLHLAAEYCDRILVMHAGHIVETAPTEQLFHAARHPYTAKLIAATPGEQGGLDEIAAIPGQLPDLRAAELPPCRYSERCERRHADCATPGLRLQPLNPDHWIACRRPL